MKNLITTFLSAPDSVALCDIHPIATLRVEARLIVNAPIEIVPILNIALVKALDKLPDGPARSFCPSWNYYQLLNMELSINLKKQSTNQNQ